MHQINFDVYASSCMTRQIEHGYYKHVLLNQLIGHNVSSRSLKYIDVQFAGLEATSYLRLCVKLQFTVPPFVLNVSENYY